MTEERKGPNLTINLGVRQQKHIVPQRFYEAPWPNGIECSGLRNKRCRFYLEELTTVGAFFRSLQFMLFRK